MIDPSELPQPQAACVAAIDDRIIDIINQSLRFGSVDDWIAVCEATSKMAEYSNGIISIEDWPSKRRRDRDMMIQLIGRCVLEIMMKDD